MRIIPMLILLLLMLTPASVAAQVRYKADEGILHLVNLIDEVPEQYRAGAVGGPVHEAKPSETSRGQIHGYARIPAGGSAPAPRSTSPNDLDVKLYESKWKWARNVGVCTAMARESGGSRSHFDATIRGPGKVDIIGTTAEQFEFQRCMRESGHSLK